MTSFSETVRVGDADMTVYANMPAEADTLAAIVVIQHGAGVDTFTRAMVNRLTDAGYAAAAPDLYHRFDRSLDATAKRQRLKDNEIIADVDATVAFLRAHPRIDAARLGITGFCMGGRVVYLMAAASSYFKAAVAYYGGNIMVPWGEGVQPPFARTGEISCPLLFHFGAEDTNPSPEDMRKLDEELTRCGKEHEFHTYENAGHAFMDFTNAQRYREPAEQASWPRTLAFFARHLGSPTK
jgi:carboxymethylenebutenolidase